MNMHVDVSVLVVDDLTSARCTGFARVVQLQLSALPIHAAKSRMAWHSGTEYGTLYLYWLTQVILALWPLNKCSISYLSLPYLTSCGRHFTTQCWGT